MMGPGRGVRSAAGRLPGQRTENIGKTLRRLLARMRRELAWLGLALLMGVISVAFVVSGPKILGNATNVLFDGVVSKQFKTGTTKAQAVAQLRAHGHGQIADMVAKMNITPGAGVEMKRLGLILGLAALVYLLGAIFTWGQGYVMAGVTQRTMFRLRRDVEEKLARLP